MTKASVRLRWILREAGEEAARSPESVHLGTFGESNEAELASSWWDIVLIDATAPDQNMYSTGFIRFRIGDEPMKVLHSGTAFRLHRARVIDGRCRMQPIAEGTVTAEPG